MYLLLRLGLGCGFEVCLVGQERRATLGFAPATAHPTRVAASLFRHRLRLLLLLWRVKLEP